MFSSETSLNNIHSRLKSTAFCVLACGELVNCDWGSRFLSRLKQLPPPVALLPPYEFLSWTSTCLGSSNILKGTGQKEHFVVRIQLRENQNKWNHLILLIWTVNISFPFLQYIKFVHMRTFKCVCCYWRVVWRAGSCPSCSATAVRRLWCHV